MDNQVALPDASMLLVYFFNPEDFFQLSFMGEKYQIIGKNDVDCYVGIAQNQQVFFLESADGTISNRTRYIAININAFVEEIYIYKKCIKESELPENPSDEQLKQDADRLRTQIMKIDDSAFYDENTYWSVIVEQMEYGLL